MWKPILLFCVAVSPLIAAAAVFYGALRWKSRTVSLEARLKSMRQSLYPPTYNEREIEQLPTPVRKYFRAVLENGQQLVTTARMQHNGEFNASERVAAWRSFASTQFSVVCRPGFLWSASIRFLPGIKIFVHDAYIGGEGILLAQVLGLFTVADGRDPEEMAQGELMRFLAEAVWYPTALLPSQGVQWEGINPATARATLRDGDVEASLDFHFDPDGLIWKVYAQARPRRGGKSNSPAPWQGRYWNYALRDGMLIPHEAEVAWQFEGREHPYWRGRMAFIAYEFAATEPKAKALSAQAGS